MKQVPGSSSWNIHNNISLISPTVSLLGKHWWKPLMLARHNDNPLSELSHNRRSDKFRRGQKREEMTNLPESFPLESILAERYVCCQEGPWVRRWMGQARWLARDNPEASPISIKPETVSNVVTLPCCALPGCSFPVRSLAFSACVSPSFLSVRQEPTLRPWKVSLFLQQVIFLEIISPFSFLLHMELLPETRPFNFSSPCYTLADWIYLFAYIYEYHIELWFWIDKNLNYN